MTPEFLKSLIDQDEGQHVEFKEIANAKVAKTIAAFASADGGTVLVGVEDKTGIIKGISDFEAVSQTCQNLTNVHVAPIPLFTYERVTADGLKVLAIKVSKGVFPVYAFKDKPVLRVGASNQPMSPEECHLRWRTYEFREGLEKLTKVVSDSAPWKNTAAAIYGQSELATMSYSKLLSLIKRDLSRVLHSTQN